VAASVGERYVLLGLRLGRLVDGLVDGYFGPPELQAAAESGDPPAAGDLRAEAVALRAEVAAAELDPQQRRWLLGQLDGIACTAELTAGGRVPWGEAVRRCYGIEVGMAPEEHFERIEHRLDAVLPGSGTVADRLQRWSESQYVPTESLLDGYSALTDELRARTRRLVDLPADEGIEAELVSGKPWSAYNWYLGQRRSRIDINTDLPLRAHALAVIAAHEGYPGHHTEHACKEAHLLDELGRVESSILMIHTPENLVAEGIAQVALRAALGEDWPAEVARILRPLDIQFDAGVAGVVAEAENELRRVEVNVAYLAHEQGWSVDELVAYERQWALSNENRARKRVEFATDPLWGIYVPTYSFGEPLVRAYAEKEPANMARLLTEQITTADLL
jgi:hypothetical protein